MKLLERFRPAPRFGSYAEAMQACEGYEASELVRLVREKTIRYRDSLNGERSPLAAFLTGPNVLDFGGACGAHYFLARSLRTDLHWHVVETPAMVRAAKNLEDGHLKFFDNLREAAESLGHIDLLFTSGALQYVTEPYAVLMELVNLGVCRMLIARMALADEDIISVQTSRLRDNGPGPLPEGFHDSRIRYPVTFMRKDGFEHIVSARYETAEHFREEKRGYWAGKWVGMYRYVLTIK